MAAQNQLWMGDIRQVMVTGIPGVRQLPCMPNPGCKSPMGYVPNGTFLTFLGVINLGSDPDSAMWHMRFTDRPEIEVLITPDAMRQGWLWKAKRPKYMDLLARRR